MLNLSYRSPMVRVLLMVFLLSVLSCSGLLETVAVRGESVSAEFPDDLSLGALLVGENLSSPLEILLSGSGRYSLYVASDRDRMSEWREDMGSYMAGVELSMPLVFVVADGTEHVIGRDPIMVLSGVDAETTGTLAFRLRQMVTFDDRPTRPGRLYRILVTYTLVADI